VKPAELSGTKKKGVYERKMNSFDINRTKISGTYMEA
jgi:hypothetical protein